MGRYSLKKNLLNEAVVDIGDRSVSLAPLGTKTNQDYSDIDLERKDQLALLVNILVYFRDKMYDGLGAQVGTQVGEPIAEQMMGGSQTNEFGNPNSVFSDIIGDDGTYYSVKSIEGPNRIARQGIYFSKIIKLWTQQGGAFDVSKPPGERASGNVSIDTGMVILYPTGDNVNLTAYGPWPVNASIINQISKKHADGVSGFSTPSWQDIEGNNIGHSGSSSGTTPSQWATVMGAVEGGSGGGSEQTYTLTLPSGQFQSMDQFDEEQAPMGYGSDAPIYSMDVGVEIMEYEKERTTEELSRQQYNQDDYRAIRSYWKSASKSTPSKEGLENFVIELFSLNPGLFPGGITTGPNAFIDMASVLALTGKNFKAAAKALTGDGGKLKAVWDTFKNAFREASQQRGSRLEDVTLGQDRSDLDKAQKWLRKKSLSLQYAPEEDKKKFIKALKDTFGDDFVLESVKEFFDTGILNEERMKKDLRLFINKRNPANRIWDSATISRIRMKDR